MGKSVMSSLGDDKVVYPVVLVKDPFSLTVMLCALFVVKRGH